MLMYNRETGQQAEWVTIEGVEFLEVEGGNFIPKGRVGSDWVQFNDETTSVLLELADNVANEDNEHFLLIKHLGEGAQVLGHNLSDRMVLNFIMTMIDNFTQDDPIRAIILMIAIKEELMVEEDDE